MRLWLAVLLLVGVSATQIIPSATDTRTDLIPYEARIDRLPNGCAIAAAEWQAAVAAKAGLAGYKIWARVVRVDYPGDRPSHAMTVFALPRSGKVFVYDVNKGTTPLGTRSQNYFSIAWALRRYDERIVYVDWLD